MSDIISEEEVNKPQMPNSKKYLIVSALILLFIIILIIIIIIISSSTPPSENKENEDKEIKRDKIGEIKCTYEISQTNTPIQILGNDFKNENNFDIMIDSNKVDFVKQYKFDTVGEHKINFIVYDQINMNFMFKDISSLKQVVMSSEKDAKIKSMESTFENTKNLEDFTITGFNTGETISVKKMLLLLLILIQKM